LSGIKTFIECLYYKGYIYMLITYIYVIFL
jgi:hypothetical protein